MLASLNHPNIGSIYGLEEADGVRALVLELIEGPTLADRIKQGPIPIDEALPIARQIAEALEAAHEQGVIHRDLKPANVKVKADGTVKVLDFGLAKAFQPDASDPNMSMSPTISLTQAATQMGMVIGTAAYMAPEQAKGKVVDKRADVWAFGAVLYEMLTGKKPFVGDDVSDTLALVLKFEPEWDSFPTEVPARVRQLIQACLQKNPKQRVHDVADVRLAMEGAFETTARAPDEPAVERPLRPWQQPVPLVLAVLALVTSTGVAVWQLKPQPLVRAPVRFAIPPPPVPGTVELSNSLRDVEISPDGTRVVYTAGGGNPLQFYVRPLDALVATPLEGLDDRVYNPVVSPDNAWVIFLDRGDNTLNRVAILGGPSVLISRMNGALFGASWGVNDTIIFGTSTPGGLWRVSADGGEPEELTTPNAERGEVNHGWPHVLPGGRAVLFTIFTDGPVDTAQIAVLELETGNQTVLVPGGSDARYAPTGHIVYGAAGTLRAVGFDLDRLEVTTGQIPVLDGVVTKSRSGAANFSLSRDGTLVYVPRSSGTPGGQTALVWVDREGREEPLGLPPGDYSRPSVSPDGTRLVVQLGADEGSDVWVSEAARSTLSILTPEPGDAGRPLWNPEGERVVFAAQTGVENILMWKAADGSGGVERLLAAEGLQQISPHDWSSDGRQLLFGYRGTSGDRNIGLLSLDGERTWRPLLNSAAREGNAAVSPDGGWVAYDSDETGRPEVYLARFPELEDKQAVSIGGGHEVLWSPDGRELFYRSIDGTRMMAVSVSTGPTLTLGTATVLFEGRPYRSGNGRQHDLAPDGRFLMIKTDDTMTDGDTTTAANQVVVVQNWFQDLLERVPVN